MRKTAAIGAPAILLLALAFPAFAEDLRSPIGEHVMLGTITKLDKTTGRVSVETAEAPLELHFPAAALESFKQGDKVAVELAISKDVSAAAADTQKSATVGHSHGPGTGSASPQY